MKQRISYLFFVLFILMTTAALATPSSNLPDKDADPLGMKGQAFSTHKPKAEKVYEGNLKRQIESLQRANRYAKKAYSSEKFSTLKRNVKKTIRHASKVIPKDSVPLDQNYEELLIQGVKIKNKAIESKVLSTAQSIYVYSKLALESRNWKEAQGYMKKAMKISDELLYPERQQLLEDGDIGEYVKNIL